MSQKTVSKATAPARVSSGIPWWIWGLLLLIGGGIAFSLVQRSIPEDPALIFEAALAAADSQKGEVFQQKLEELKKYPEFSSQQKMLEALLMLGRSRPLKAIPLLEEAVNEPTIRRRALSYLGTAYAQSDNLLKAAEVFESVLKDDAEDHSARQNLASILTQLFAFEEAIGHLTLLAEKEYKLARVLGDRAELNLELGRYAEAAADFEGSIKADETDPTNALKAEKLIDCLTRLGQFQKAEEFVGGVDRPGTEDLLKAERLLAEGQMEELEIAIQKMRGENAGSAKAASVFGRAALKKESSDRAAEAMVFIKRALVYSTRDLDLYKVAVDVARLAGDEEFAGLAQQNVDLLESFNQQYFEQLPLVAKTRDDIEGRLSLAKLATETGRLEVALKLYDALLRIDPENESKYSTFRVRLYDGLSQLVSTQGRATDPASPAAPPDGEAPQSPSSPPEAANPPAESDAPTAADEKPADEKPAEEKPADEKPAEEKPAEEKPAADDGASEESEEKSDAPPESADSPKA